MHPLIHRAEKKEEKKNKGKEKKKKGKFLASIFNARRTAHAFHSPLPPCRAMSPSPSPPPYTDISDI